MHLRKLPSGSVLPAADIDNDTVPASPHNPQHDPNTETDAALIEAARVGLFAERVGLPLLAWQQRYLDRLFAKKRRPGPD